MIRGLTVPCRQRQDHELEVRNILIFTASASDPLNGLHMQEAGT